MSWESSRKPKGHQFCYRTDRGGGGLSDIKDPLFPWGSSPILGSLCLLPEERYLSMPEIGEKERNYYLSKSYTDYTHKCTQSFLLPLPSLGYRISGKKSVVQGPSSIHVSKREHFQGHTVLTLAQAAWSPLHQSCVEPTRHPSHMVPEKTPGPKKETPNDCLAWV